MELPTTPEELQAVIDKEVGGLKNKNTELLGKMDALKTQVASLDGIDLEALQKASTELEALKQKGLEETGEYKKLYNDAGSVHATEKEALQKQIDELKGTNTTMTKKGQVNDSLNTLKIVPELREMAINDVMSKVGLNDEGVAMVGDKTVTEYVKDWAETPVGKAMILSGNSGGGGNGGGGGGKGEEASWFDKKSPKYNVTKQAQLAKTNPALHKQLSGRG